jgi:putative DNA primase/helicase
MRAQDVHAAVDWPSVLRQLGVDGQYLTNRHGPCPVCGGNDRFRFDDKGRGLFYCNGCGGAGDGFQLLQRLHGWTFKVALAKVTAAAGLIEVLYLRPTAPVARTDPDPASPTARVRELLRQSCDPQDVADVREYLAHRRLQLPIDCPLRAHAGAAYFEDKQQIGRFPTLVAPVRDVDGVLVTAHITYLKAARKLTEHQPRKLLSPLTGRIGCAVRLTPVTGDTLGIAEGIETALAAHQLHQVPTWAALNTSLLSKFEPPMGIRNLIIFADRDFAGVTAAAYLMERLQGPVRLELRIAPAPHGDWNDALLAGNAP